MAVEIEAKKIEYQMNNYMKQKQKAKFKASYFTKSEACNTFDDIDSHIVQEKERYIKKIKTWNSMLKCDQWNLIKAFVEASNDTAMKAMLKEFRHALLNGKINVSYDKINNTVMSVSL